MEFIGFVFVVFVALVFTLYLGVALFFGGTDLQALAWYHWGWILALIFIMWYAVLNIAPFTITVSG